MTRPAGADNIDAITTAIAGELHSEVTSLCSCCKATVSGRVVLRDGRVYMHKTCAHHGAQECLVSTNAEWWLDCLEFPARFIKPRRVLKQVERGCPHDCGTCTAHEQKVYLPVIPITSACNLDCPICYTINKNESAYRLARKDFQLILDHLREDHVEVDIINFTGGEPTLHPALPEFLKMCRDAGIRRLTISTNGLELLDEEYVRALAALDARIVLSLDTFRPETDHKLLGANTVKAKLKVLDLLAKHDVVTTILPAVAAGVNDDEVGQLLELVLARPNICSLEMHTLTFTGQGGVSFARSARITTPDLHARVEQATGGKLTWRDFVPSPLAHPHCYSICYMLALDGGGFVPFARFMDRERFYELLSDSLYIEPREKIEMFFRDIIDGLWADPDRVPESERVLATLRRLLDEMFPADRTLPIHERQRISERCVKAIYIHSHMDEENFDTARVAQCCVGVPSPDGTNIPTCSYNVLYRERDVRFADASMLERMAALRPRPARS